MHALAFDLFTRGELAACCDVYSRRMNELAQVFDTTGYSDAAKVIKTEKVVISSLLGGGCYERKSDRTQGA